MNRENAVEFILRISNSCFKANNEIDNLLLPDNLKQKCIQILENYYHDVNKVSEYLLKKDYGKIKLQIYSIQNSEMVEIKDNSRW